MIRPSERVITALLCVSIVSTIGNSGLALLLAMDGSWGWAAMLGGAVMIGLQNIAYFVWWAPRR